MYKKQGLICLKRKIFGRLTEKNEAYFRQKNFNVEKSYTKCYNHTLKEVV